MAMNPVNVVVLGIGEGSGIAQELFDLLVKEEWCRAELRLAGVEGVSCMDLPAGCVAVAVSPDPGALSTVVRRLASRSPYGLFVFVDLFRDLTQGLNLLVSGFTNFLPYPFKGEEVAACLKSSIARKPGSLRTEVDLVTQKLAPEVGLQDLIGCSASFNRVLQEIRVLARVDATVLIVGETGTGKDMSGRAIHYSSPRSSRPFLPVNCGAIPDELFANELFGHERGAFTDARARHSGLIQEAEGGTLFLDDIESLSLNNQAKLLRFLQCKEYTPLGLGKPRTANVRVIAATNADLVEMVRQKRFREDLYFRLEVMKLSLPPLRQRLGDIPVLANYLVSRYSAAYGKILGPLTDRALQKLCACNWPGNVRQLENVIHKAVVYSISEVLTESDFDLDTAENRSTSSDDFRLLPFDQARGEVLSRFEREYVTHLLQVCGGNITRAARYAGKHRRSFWEIMRRNNLTRPQP
jgi:DNA-binding NtrC family response regulator